MGEQPEANEVSGGYTVTKRKAYARKTHPTRLQRKRGKSVFGTFRIWHPTGVRYRQKNKSPQSDGTFSFRKSWQKRIPTAFTKRPCLLFLR